MHHDLSYILLVFVCELLFGILFNFGIAYAKRQRYLEGFNWLAGVIAGAAVLTGLLLIDWKAALIASGIFICAGVPLVSGEIWRYLQARKASQRYIVDEVERER